MSDVIDRPLLEQEKAAKDPASHHRLRCASEPAFACRTSTSSCRNAGQQHLKDLRQSSAHALYRHHGPIRGPRR